MDPTKIAKNPGLCSLAKLMVNLLWGKFGQRDNLIQVKTFSTRIPSACSWTQNKTTPDTSVASVKIGWRCTTGSNWVEVHYRAQDHLLGTFTPVRGTGTPQTRVVFDTDSVIYVRRPVETDVTTGPNLGDFTHEVDPGQHITEFCSGGPKIMVTGATIRRQNVKSRGTVSM